MPLRNQSLVVEAFSLAEANLPFEMLGVDTDNDSAFMNQTVFDHCKARGLRGLERDGLLTRTVFPNVPPRVDYELTELGNSLRVPIETLGYWAFANLDTIPSARGSAGGARAARW